MESFPSTYLIPDVPLQVFGCTTYVHSHGLSQTKFTPRAQTCVFVGYPLHERSYKFLHPIPHKYFLSMNITFPEDCPFFLVSLLHEVKDRLGNLDDYDPSPDIPIVLKKAFTTSLDSTMIPKNIHAALKCPEWKTAIMEEMRALEKNKTWELYALPKGHKTVFTTFVVKFQGYSQGHSDHTLFTKVFKAGKIDVLIVYVDDIVLSGDDTIDIIQLRRWGMSLGLKTWGI
ncbi:reverse transcriptase [Cucumis melo var. makuwa]|uniref:Reverse transcriptase n=1 Tax=Cucumis melo var. makuwa TaxID=1194695 RepID=A0A5A7THW1_CUCMM|nr:reverse transcriptase [Cucumis melo var. makuwa]TYK05295.1 reverse transcriptase [Cucumis melo var. makuwa]